MNKLSYRQLSCASIGQNKNLIISECIKDKEVIGFTMAQQMIVKEGKKEIGLFLKNGIHVEGLNNLYELRNALNDAIYKLEEKK